MATASHQSCIDACNACADACNRCAMACLQEPQPKLMARCVALDIDCAAACQLAVGYMSRGSANDSAACAFCAMVCTACADECERHQMEHCQACAQACRACARECERMASHRPRSETVAGTHAKH
ncbi:MAG: four-helix bundle copper-binding protein [Rhizobacter sp.]|nr:four-helix bundle copper-binding protein [Rhizobacter sp.]